MNRLLAWIRFLLWPPFVLLAVFCVAGFLIAGIPGEMFAGGVWLLLMIRAPYVFEPALDWYERIWSSEDLYG